MIFRRTATDATAPPEVTHVPVEVRPDPEVLLAEAERALADAEAEAVRVTARLKADAAAVAAEKRALAEQVKAELAQEARRDAYFAAVTLGRADYERALSEMADAATLVERNAAERDEVAMLLAGATTRARESEHAYAAALRRRGTDLDELAELRIALAASTSLPDAVAEQLARADEGHRRAVEAHGRATDVLKVAWRHLEILAATDGVECPQGLGLTAAEKRAARLRDLERDAQILALAAGSPEYQARRAQRQARRDAMRRVLHPAYDPLTRAGNAAATFLGNQHRG